MSLWKDDDRLVLIDGHNRKRICEKHDINFTTKQLKFKDREHVKLWMCERQLGRRNLTDDQRAIVANDKREALSAIASQEQLQGARDAKKVKTSGEATVSSPVKKERTRATVAKDANISERKIKYAQEIKKNAPEVSAMVRSGKVTLVEGKKIAALPESARKEAIKVVSLGGNVRGSCADCKARRSLLRVYRCDRRLSDVGGVHYGFRAVFCVVGALLT